MQSPHFRSSYGVYLNPLQLSYKDLPILPHLLLVQEQLFHNSVVIYHYSILLLKLVQIWDLEN